METRTSGMVPTIYRSLTRQSTLRHTSLTSPLFASTRQISSTPFRYAADQKPTSDEVTSTPRPDAASSSSSSPDFSSMINQALDFTRASPNTSQGRNAHFASSKKPASQTSPRSRISSLDDLAAGFSTPTRSSSARGNSVMSGLDINSMLDPANRTPRNGNSYRAAEPMRYPDPLPAYGPSVGRTVAVDPNRGMDVGRAFRSLEINCARNKVRADFNKQRFHERPGLKRKRLRSERWRRRFREGFKGMVKMVSSMKKQGW